MPTRDELVVREARPTDVEPAELVTDAAFSALRAIYRPTGDAIAHQARRAQLRVRVVAVLGDSVVGTVQFEVHSEHVHLIGLAVRPDFQRQGVARRLIEHVAMLAPSLGRSVLAIYTVRETGNVAVFERLGFHVTAEAPTDLFESDTFSQLHEVKMERSLDSSG